MVDEIGLTKVFSDDFVERIPFIGSLAWDPEACGIQSQGRALYFTIPWRGRLMIVTYSLDSPTYR